MYNCTFVLVEAINKINASVLKWEYYKTLLLTKTVGK